MFLNKNVLVIAFYFPPQAGVGVVRTAKFCKLLPNLNWTPLVLTVDSRYYKSTSEGHMGDLPSDLSIARIPYLSFPGNRVAIKVLFSFIAALYALIKRKDYDVIYLSGSPYYPFPVLSFFGALFRKPVILDFRDSWSFNHGFDGRTAQNLWQRVREKVYGLMERFSFRYASKAIFATTTLHEEYATRFKRSRSKFLTIHNGIDLDDFKQVNPRRVSDKKTIIVAGQFKIYLDQAVVSFLRCLTKFPELHFLYIGEESEQIISDAKLTSAASQVTALPFLPYQQVIEYIAGSDAAIVSTGLKNGMGTKIFDYLALNKNVLCFVPPESVITKQFGKEPSIVISESPHDEAKITAALSKIVSLEEQPIVPIQDFTRQRAAKLLAEQLNELVSH